MELLSSVDSVKTSEISTRSPTNWLSIPTVSFKLGMVNCSMLQDYPEIYRAVCDSCVYFLFAMLPYINWTFPLKPSDFKKLKDRIVLSLLAAIAKFLPVEKKEQIKFV